MVYHVAGYHNVDPAIFLDMTIVEINLYTEGKTDERRERVEYEFMSNDALNHLLGHYVYFALNEPTKYPKQPFTKVEQTRQQVEQTAEQLAINLQAWMGALGGKEVVHVETNND